MVDIIFTRGSNWKALTVKILVFWMHESSPMGGGRLLQVNAWEVPLY